MDLIYDVNGTSSPVRNSTFSFLGRLEMPDDSIESCMFNNLGSSERHVSSSRKTAAKLHLNSLTKLSLAFSNDER